MVQNCYKWSKTECISLPFSTFKKSQSINQIINLLDWLCLPANKGPCWGFLSFPHPQSRWMTFIDKYCHILARSLYMHRPSWIRSHEHKVNSELERTPLWVSCSPIWTFFCIFFKLIFFPFFVHVCAFFSFLFFPQNTTPITYKSNNNYLKVCEKDSSLMPF